MTDEPKQMALFKIGEGDFVTPRFDKWRTSHLMAEMDSQYKLCKTARIEYERISPSLKDLKQAVKEKDVKSIVFRGDTYDIKIARGLIRFVENFKGEQYERMLVLEKYALEVHARGFDASAPLSYVAYERGL